MSWRTSSLILLRDAVPWTRNGSPMIEPTVLRGFSDAYGSWKIRVFSDSVRWHADAWWPSAGRSSGTSVLHTSITYGQRGLNGHPGGTKISDGGSPLIGCSRSVLGWSIRVIDCSRPHVYG